LNLRLSMLQRGAEPDASIGRPAFIPSVADGGTIDHWSGE